ncbi:MAG TPA: ABC transporter permease, partial [Tahibacter sp.]|nr:ABC transporter permease [Tahibacter sp.]
YAATVEKNPGWLAPARKALTEWSRTRELARLGVTDAQFKALGEPVKLDVRRTDGARVFDDQATRSFSILLTVLSLVACASGCGLMFQTITGEKNHRVSEVVLSCIPAQAWIDGKVAAITLVGLKTILLYLFYITVGAAVLTERTGIVGASGLLSFTTVGWVALFSLAGLVLWNSFFAAAAATASGDYGSARRTLILFPMIFYIVCFVGVDNPENAFMQVLSFFPFSAAIAMPLRIVHGVVPLWQVLVSLGALIAGAVAMRALAGAIFRTGMLLYGKSPSMFSLARHLVFGPRQSAPPAIVSEPRGEAAP